MIRARGQMPRCFGCCSHSGMKMHRVCLSGGFFFLATLDSHVVCQHSVSFSFLPAPPLRSTFTSVRFCAETGIHSDESAVSLALAEVLFNPRVLLAGKEEKFQFWAANQSQRSYQIQLKPI